MFKSKKEALLELMKQDITSWPFTFRFDNSEEPYYKGHGYVNNISNGCEAFFDYFLYDEKPENATWINIGLPIGATFEFNKEQNIARIDGQHLNTSVGDFLEILKRRELLVKICE